MRKLDKLVQSSSGAIDLIVSKNRLFSIAYSQIYCQLSKQHQGKRFELEITMTVRLITVDCKLEFITERFDSLCQYN